MLVKFLTEICLKKKIKDKKYYIEIYSFQAFTIVLGVFYINEK